MDGRPTWTDCDEAGDYAVPNVLSPRDIVSRPDSTSYMLVQYIAIFTSVKNDYFEFFR